ncbi:MAG: Ni,Fe-hydrogenase III large subunit [Parcubacteria group bacterium GW2011_GWD2_38_11]|nr:MAG: Ni,Fe-hydrogenase III large subunit [Parcubacteria group bacterium GW2011_GWD2_38_11]
MSIHDILKKFPQVIIVEQKNDTVFATVSREDLAGVVTSLVDEHKLFLSSLYGTDNRKENQTFGVNVIFGDDANHQWLKLSASLPENDPRYPSITRTIMAAHWYERYMQDMFGVVAEGHPDSRRLVNHENIPEGVHPLQKDFIWNTKLEKANVAYPMHHISGEGIFEIPVGPIHAGIIEPGHFRFNVAGERILTLEGKLFFTHKGVEKLMEGKSPKDALPYVEGISGDMAASHSLAYIQAIETISNCNLTDRAKMLRTLVLELERLTMHIHDLANIGGMGTGYSFIAANGFRIKERMMRLSDDIFGNRFWREFISIGGVARDLSEMQLKNILEVSKDAYAEMNKIVNLALASDGFLDRLQTTGVLPLEAAKAFGALGIAARGSGLDRDVRRDHPYAAYEKYPTTVSLKKKGDVHSRYLVRIEEMKITIELIERLIAEMAGGGITTDIEIKDGFAIGAVESWRGEILCALEIKNGVIERCFPRDPSFCNWALFGIMGPGNIVPDFPLINKSLNLSYSGTDL